MRQAERRGSNNQEKVLRESLESIAAKFILNLPVEERSQKLRLAFHYKKAYYFYIDCQIKEINPSQNPRDVQLKWFIDNLNTVVSHYIRPLSAEDVNKILSMQRPTCGAIILNQRSNKALVVSSQGRYGFPKGMKNQSQTSEACAARQVKQQVGLFVHNKININDKVEFLGRGDAPVTFFIVQKFDQRQPLKIDKNQIDDAFWMSVSDISKSLGKFSQKCRRAWREYQKNIQIQPNLSMEQFLNTYRDKPARSKQKSKPVDYAINPLLNFKLDRDRLFSVFRTCESTPDST